MTNLKTHCKNVLLNEVIKESCQENDGLQWHVLIVNQFTMRMISNCCNMREISAKGITIVEELEKRREALPSLGAIYLITSDEMSIQALLHDLNVTSPKYRDFHIFCVESIPDKWLAEIRKSKHIKRIEALKEVNMSFVPYESNVFLLDSEFLVAKYVFNTQLVNEPIATQHLEKMAEQIATLCVTLNQFPVIRFRGAHPRMAKLAHLLEQHMERYKENETNLGKKLEKIKTQVILIDRGFDCISPILHEVTYQAMIHEHLNVENNIYKYQDKVGATREYCLTGDEYWNDIKHKHIVEASLKVSEDYHQFLDSNEPKISPGRKTEPHIKQVPKYQKELTVLNMHQTITDHCMTILRRIEALCEAEQDIATGEKVTYEKVTDVLARIRPIFSSQNDSTNTYTACEKLRMMLLFSLVKQGIDEESMKKLFLQAGIDMELRSAVTNLEFLGFNPYQPGRRDPYKMDRIERQRNRVQLTHSRWIPLIKDVMELAVEDKLDQRIYPFRSSKATAPIHKALTRQLSIDTSSAEMKLAGKHKLIVFVVGGVTFSEIRSAYEVMESKKNCEVFIGSNYILTPNRFLEQLLCFADVATEETANAVASVATFSPKPSPSPGKNQHNFFIF